MIEPPADLRMIANMMFQLYTAFIQAGFTETQAMELVKVHFATVVRENIKEGGSSE
jgi:hypothetical protein